jgi:hypothetical protein
METPGKKGLLAVADVGMLGAWCSGHFWVDFELKKMLPLFLSSTWTCIGI